MPAIEQKILLHRFALVVLCLIIMGAAAALAAKQLLPDSSLRFTLAATGLPTEGRWKSMPVVEDINDDGFLDLAAHPRLGEGTHVWFGDGRGNWREASQGLTLAEGSCGGGLDIGDINQDGKLDLAVADHCTGVFVFLGDKRGHWRVTTSALNPAVAKEVPKEELNPFVGAEHLALGDINLDGKLDLVVSASDRGGFSVYTGDGQGHKWKEIHGDGLPSADDPEIQDVQKGGWANKFLLHDMNGDGNLDIVASYYAGPRVWLGDGKGHWQSKSEGLPSLDVGGSFWGVAVGDINEDSRPDLLLANIVHGPQVFLQQKDGSWKKTADVIPDLKGGAWSGALGDFDGDSHLDMVIGAKLRREAGSSYGLFVLQGDGKGGWTKVADTGLPTTGLGFPWGIAVNDINGDDRLDIAVTTNPPPRQSPLQGSRGKNKQVNDQKKQEHGGADLPRVQIWLNQGKSS